MNSFLLKSKWLLQKHISNRFYIVAYNNIVENLEGQYLFDLNSVSCDRKSFEDQLEFYQENFNIISYIDLDGAIDKRKRDRPFLIITFDGGQKSFYNIAAPRLNKLNIPATVFLPTSYIGTNKIFWWDDFSFLCNKLSCEIFFKESFSTYFYPDSKLQFAINNGEDYFKPAFLHYCRNIEEEQICKFSIFLRKKYASIYNANKHLFSQVEMMSWEQIKELSGHGIQFGTQILSHGLHHRCLLDEEITQITSSKQIIGQHIYQKITTFCTPPRPNKTSEIDDVLIKLGYNHSCTQQFGSNSFSCSPFAHKRINIERWMRLDDITESFFNTELCQIKNKMHRAVAESFSTANKIKIASSLIPISLRPKTHMPVQHIFIAICDHYEPYWRYASHLTAYKRVKKWIDSVPAIFDNYKDSDGRKPIHTFFYPEEEYKKGLLNMLTTLQDSGYGEVEIHLHHDMDTSNSLRVKLNTFKRKLSDEHGMLSTNKNNGSTSYAFIHGNWALDNSRHDGRWCGVNDEISLLQTTGCFADFTMPSAPSDCQTAIKNSIYYAVGNPMKSKSHDSGTLVSFNQKGQDGLLMVQGPLTLRKNGTSLKIENGELTFTNYATHNRIASWMNCPISVLGKPDWVFVKLHTHGAQEQTMQRLFDMHNYEELFSLLEEMANRANAKLHYVSARQMVNVVHALEDGLSDWDPILLDYQYVKTNC